MKKLMSKIIFVTGLCLASVYAWAQHAPGSHFCMTNPGFPGCYVPPSSGNGGGASGGGTTVTHVYFKNRYGAVAVSPTTGLIGVSDNQKCRKTAEEQALAQCGDSSCAVDYYRNTCVAVVVGSVTETQGNTVRITNDNIETAKKLAVQKCNANGAKNCKVLYAACSLPVRI